MEKQRAPALAQAPENAAAAAPDQASSGRGAVTAPVPKLTSMAELPLAIQQELPPMSISVHAYSGKAAERLVGINDRLLHEGDDVAPGFKLEQITPTGMILSYKGYRFLRGVR
jgi:general secretion pathway protein B